MNPKRIIADYYDSLVRDIDVFIEGRLEKVDVNCDELNRVRKELIEATRQVETETFEFYEKTIREELRDDESLRSLSLEEGTEYLRSKLFSHLYAVLFICNIGQKAVLLILRDFDLTKQHRIYLK